jgi:hypothetical protein
MSRTHVAGLAVLLAAALLIPLLSLPPGLAGQPTGPAKPARPRGKPLAVIGNETITEQDLVVRLKAFSRSEQAEAVTQEGRKALLDRLIYRRLLSREAKRLGLDRDPEVAVELELARERVLFESYMERQVLDQVKVTKEEVRDYYETHKADFPGQSFGEAKKAVRTTLRDEKASLLVSKRTKALWEREQVKIDEARLAQLDLTRTIGRRRPSAVEILRMLEKRGKLPEELRKVLEEGTIKEGPPPKQ